MTCLIKLFIIHLIRHLFNVGHKSLKMNGPTKEVLQNVKYQLSQRGQLINCVSIYLQNPNHTIKYSQILVWTQIL